MNDVLLQILPSKSSPSSAAEERPGGAASRTDASAAKSFFIETFGCQMNVHDSEKVAGALTAKGYQQAANCEEADVIFYNTCSIREKAAQKVFSYLGALKKAHGVSKLVGVLGCVAQQEGERIFDRAPEVRLVCGSASYSRIGELMARLEAGERRITGLSLETDECFETEITSRGNPFRAYITIIEGCNKACSYCVVPMTRGPERSRPSASVIGEARRLADNGYTEIQLLGQTVNSYHDPSGVCLSFADLLLRVADVPGIRRVRFTTSHPRDLGPEIIRAIESSPALCNHVHLPAQCGSTRVLEAMKRGYTRDQYLEKIDCIRSAKRDISISTDIIVGFCGETPDDFDETISLLEAAEYDQVFAFKYSPRPRTTAGKLPDSVPEEEKRLRLARLQERQRTIQLRRNQRLAGRQFEVLVEGYQPKLGQCVGRTTSNHVINFPGPPEWVGRYADVRVASAGPNSLAGNIVASAAGHPAAN